MDGGGQKLFIYQINVTLNPEEWDELEQQSTVNLNAPNDIRSRLSWGLQLLQAILGSGRDVEPVLTASPRSPRPSFPQTTDDVEPSIQQLLYLNKTGVLTDEEFAKKKAEILARENDQMPPL